MKATVTYAHPDGTTERIVIKGRYLTTQQCDGGRSLVTVYHRGRKVRTVQFAHASVIDCDRRNRGT